MNKPHIWVDLAHEAHSGDECHPEHPDRIRMILKRLSLDSDRYKWSILNKSSDTVSKPVTESDSATKWTMLADGDSYYTDNTREICVRVGIMLGEAVEMIIKGMSCGFVLCRPPGHHASKVSGPRGFCHINNVWLAVEKLVERGVKSIGILDWDVHHGDGTEECVRAFSDFERVRFVSMHAFGKGIYPGTGASCHDKNILNIALPKGTKTAPYIQKFRNLALPFLEKPDVLIVSAGYDAHMKDPMKLMRLDTAAYKTMSEALKGIGCPVLFVLEGGYCPSTLAECVEATLEPWTIRQITE